MIYLLRSSSSLAKVLILPFVILIMTLSVVVGLLSYQAGHHAVVEVAEQMLKRTADSVAIMVDRHIVGSGAVLEEAFPHGLPMDADLNAELDTLRTRFWIATTLRPDLNNYVYYGNTSGDFVGLFRLRADAGELRVKRASDNYRSAYSCTSINSPLGMPSLDQTDFDPRLRPWFIAGKNSEQDVWTDIYINYWDKDLVATRARRVLLKNGKLAGVVATDVSLKGLNDFVNDMHVSAHGVVFITEANGQLIAASAGENIHTAEDGKIDRVRAEDSSNALIRSAYASLQKKLAAAENGIDSGRTFIFQATNGETIYSSYAWIQDKAGLSWLAVVAVPRSDFLESLDVNARWTVIIVVVAVVLALLLGLSVVRWVVRDVRRLSRAATRIGKGQMNVPLNIERSDEIGQLARNFNDMQNELNTDKLTGVTSRAALLRYLDAAVHQRDRRAGEKHEKFTLLFIDLNRFKAINDKLGHEYGDLVLIEAGQRLCSVAREDDVVARFGGDEFVWVFWGVADGAFADQVRQKIAAALAPPLECLASVAGAQGMTIGAAIGVAFFPQDGKDAETLIKLADHGMYEDKAAGRKPNDAMQ